MEANRFRTRSNEVANYSYKQQQMSRVREGQLGRTSSGVQSSGNGYSSTDHDEMTDRVSSLSGLEFKI